MVKQVVGHKLPKADVTLGIYFGGDLPAVLRQCVEAVVLPERVFTPSTTPEDRTA